jgi:transposase-like protein
MTKRKHRTERIRIKSAGQRRGDFLRDLFRATLQEVLGAKMSEALEPAKRECAIRRNGYRSRYHARSLITRVGEL